MYLLDKSGYQKSIVVAQEFTRSAIPKILDEIEDILPKEPAAK